MNLFQLSPEYLAVLRQFTGAEPQPYASSNNALQRRPPLPGRQQQTLQQAYYNYRKPAVVPPRPRPQLHPQALAQAEVVAQVQAQIDAQNRAAALQSARSPSGASAYQVESYTQPKVGSFDQELLQLVSANQAQEFNLIPTQPKGNYPSQQQEYVKPTIAPAASQLPEQYHIETSPPPRYPPQQRVAATYQSVGQPVPIQYQNAQPVDQPFRPSPQYDYVDDGAQLQAHQAQIQAETEASARAQAHAEAQALAFQKIAQASYQKHHEVALEQIRIDHERYRQQSALEQIQQGETVSEAGQAHIDGRLQPKDPEAAYRAKLKAQAAAEAAEARRLQVAAEQKAHADAIRQVEAQQQAHVRAQEKAHYDALNFERNQLRAQAQAQALAQAQAEALYKVYQQSRAKANSEILAAAKAQAEAKKIDPEGTPVVQYLLPNTPKLPPPNNYFTNDDVNKYQASGSTYAPRSVAKPESSESTATQEQSAYVQSAINRPRQAYKLKVPPTQSSVYISQSGILKKSPFRSVTVEEIIDQSQLHDPQVIHAPSPKDQQPLTQEELSALINAGYSVTPAPSAKPTQQSYIPQNTSGAYYLKKQRPVVRPEYVTLEEVVKQPQRSTRKNASILKQDDTSTSEKVTYLVPLEPSFGTRQPSV